VPPTPTPAAPTAEVVVRALLAAEQARDLEQVMRAYDDSAFHLLLDATAGKDAAGPTTYHNDKDQVRTYWAALLQDHLKVDVIDVSVPTDLPVEFSALADGKVEQVVVRSRQSRDSLRQAGVQLAEVLDNYYVGAGRVQSQGTIIVRTLPAAATPSVPNTFSTGVYAATRSVQHLRIGHAFVVFAPNNRFYLITGGNLMLDSGPYQVRGNELQLTSNDTDCQKAGRSPDFTYQWALEGQLLNLTTVVDRCGSGHPETWAAGPWTKQW
jgi:hypothetical protein